MTKQQQQQQKKVDMKFILFTHGMAAKMVYCVSLSEQMIADYRTNDEKCFCLNCDSTKKK